MRSEKEKRIGKLEEALSRLTGRGYKAIPPVMPENYLSEKKEKERINENLKTMAPGTRYYCPGFGNWHKDAKGVLHQISKFNRPMLLKTIQEWIEEMKTNHVEKNEIKRISKVIDKINKPKRILSPEKMIVIKEEDHVNKIRESVRRDFKK